MHRRYSRMRTEGIREDLSSILKYGACHREPAAELANGTTVVLPSIHASTHCTDVSNARNGQFSCLIFTEKYLKTPIRRKAQLPRALAAHNYLQKRYRPHYTFQNKTARAVRARLIKNPDRLTSE